ncbi:TerC family protein [Pelistega sp. MC2]|uniref:TerC family protein n=1 Tax=Pelistega sp. MC2 TaxID=1720297 RepID=UPI0008DAC7A7|nr:TerC family protein [Pelistega sp. MC2]
MLDWLEHINWGVVASIVLIDILLGGDNAVIIALASRNLEKSKRLQGILWGTFGAIIMRIVLIFFAMQLLNIPFLKVVGGVLLLWIGIKLLLPHDDDHNNIHAGTTVWSAVKTILVADFVMSLDNVIAIAGAAEKTHSDHQIAYVIFGLLVSVPIIIWGSTLVLKLIDRFPSVVIGGAALLGWIAGGMLVTDIKIVEWFFANGGTVADSNSALALVPSTVKYGAEIAGAIFVVAVGLLWAKSKKSA